MYNFDVHIRDKNWQKSVLFIECAKSEQEAIDMAIEMTRIRGLNPDECTLIGVQWTGYVTDFWRGRKLRGPRPRHYPYFKELDRDEPPSNSGVDISNLASGN